MRDITITGRSVSQLLYVTYWNRTPPLDHMNVANMWKGVVERTNQVGYFDRANTAPYIEIPAIDSSLLRSRTVRPGQFELLVDHVKQACNGSNTVLL